MIFVAKSLDGRAVGLNSDNIKEFIVSIYKYNSEQNKICFDVKIVDFNNDTYYIRTDKYEDLPLDFKGKKLDIQYLELLLTSVLVYIFNSSTNGIDIIGQLMDELNYYSFKKGLK